MRAPRRATACSRCKIAPAVEGGLCTMDIILLARQAARAYDAVVLRDPNIAGCRYEFLRRVVFTCIEDGHIFHDRPHPECPFCTPG